MEGRFEIVSSNGRHWIEINKSSIEQFHPESNLKDLGFEQEEFVKEANYFLDKYKISIPNNFPQPVITQQALFGAQPVSTSFNIRVGVCFCNCIKLERKYNINTSKILHEMIDNEPVQGLLHTTSVSIIANDYANIGYKVQPFPESKTSKKPDLLVDSIYCDIKAIQESDWTKEALGEEHREKFFTTGMAPPHYIRDEVCFDIGTFIRNRGSEAIQQADMVLVDLTEKSLPLLHHVGKVEQQILPLPTINRLVFFCCDFYKGRVDNAYYVDFSPSLWQVIRNCDKKNQRGWLPPPGAWLTTTTD